MGKGFLQIQATTGDGALPIANAHVEIFDRNGALLYETSTDASGLTQAFPLDAPEASLTLDPNYNKPAYSTVGVVISAPGFVTEHISGVEIVDTQNATLPIHMHPLAAGPNAITDDYIDIPAVGLLQPQTTKVGVETPNLRNVIIPDYITVHLGAPTEAASNMQVKFSDYAKNVASSEIYPTWPRESLLANIHAIVTFALNRVYTEWYRSRGFNFDVTNSTQYDMAYRVDGPVFSSISNIVDEYFNTYATRQGFRNPLFTSFCAGPSGTCEHGGMSQWGTVWQANEGINALQILRNAYGDDLILTSSNNITGITSSFPGSNLTTGSSSNDVRRMQNLLNRIRVNFPYIPRIESPNGMFGADTAAAVRAFQQTFQIPITGIIDRNTWNRITQLYVSVTNLASLEAEGSRITIGANPPNVVLSQGSQGQNVIELQFILNTISAFHPEIPTITRDGVFDANTRNAVIEFQRYFGLTPDGVVGPATWNMLYSVYRGIKQNAPTPSNPPLPPPTPGGPTGECFNYTVVFGDSLWLISQRFGTTVEAIMARNGLPDTNLSIGQVLCIPTSGGAPQPSPGEHFNYTVVDGDSLWLISQRFGTTVEAIMSLNGLTSSYLSIGQVLRIPTSIDQVSRIPTSGEKFGTTAEAIMVLNGLTNSPDPNLKTIVLDAGHGGSDPGAVFDNRLEKDDALRLAQAVQRILESQGQRVIMTRDSDRDVSLAERSNISNNNNADIFVSFHRDSSANTVHNGTSNFIHTSASPTTIRYADNVLSEIVRAGVQRNLGVRRANFAVLRNTNAPAMLLEMGFITNPSDNQLFDQNFNDYAAAIAHGIMQSLTESVGTQPYFYHTVAEGENLWSLAQRFGTTMDAIMELNLMTDNGVITGQVLKIPNVTGIMTTNNPMTKIPMTEIPMPESPMPESSMPESPMPESSMPESPMLETPIIETPMTESPMLETPISEKPITESPVIENLPIANPPTASPQTPSSPAPTKRYMVKYGDSLWKIAQKYDTTVEALQSTNGLTGHSLDVGQMLIIP